MHGSISNVVKAEPNLVPLLDLVLQLVMFFMLTVHFATEQFTFKYVQLPSSQSARPLDQTQPEYFILAVDRKLDPDGNDTKQRELLRLPDPYEQGVQVVADLAKPDQKNTITLFLRDKYAEFERAKESGGIGGEKMLVIIRVDQGVEYKYVYELLRMCKDAKFKKLQLRAFAKNK
jgi:biopolymer transport protein ExbD